MAGEVDGVSKTGLGFFNSSGELKSKEQLAEGNTSTSKTRSSGTSDSSSSAASTSELSPESISNAFQNAKSTFLSDANSIISVANQSDADLKAANKIVKNQLAEAKNLKQALKDNDSKAADESRQKLAKLQEQRDDLATKIEQNNRDRSPESVKSINLGSEQKGIFSVDPVKFFSSPSADLKSVKGVNELIDSLKDDKAEISTQRQEIKDLKKEVASVVSDTKAQLNELESNTVRSFEDAQKTAQNIASAVTRAGSEATLASNINESVVRSLLQ